MRPNFFIFSLPRSGSSWLSVFLSGPDSFCYHDPTADLPPYEWLSHVDNREEPIVGAVDTGAYVFGRHVIELSPTTEFFALYRDPSEINRSGRAFGITEFDAYAERERLGKLQLEPIYYSRFKDMGYLAELWKRLIGTAFDRERAKQLVEMNIQRNFSEFLMNRPDLYRAYSQWVQ